MIMTTFMWILLTYLSSVVISFPFIYRGMKQTDTFDEHFSPLSEEFVARFAAWIPLLNLYISYLFFRRWLHYKLIELSLKRIFKKIKRHDPNPGGLATKAMEDIEKMFEEDNKLI